MQSRKLGLGLALAAVAAAVILFVILQGGGSSSSGPITTGTTKIAFKNGALVGGVKDINVNKGDPVKLEVTPDIPAEVHIHGYEFAKDVKPGQTASFDFPANLDGEFDIEVHHLVGGEEQEGVQVASLTVNP
jgi:heme/copper-type cytochrome/quinol oxidase subunit 2